MELSFVKKKGQENHFISFKKGKSFLFIKGNLEMKIYFLKKLRVLKIKYSKLLMRQSINKDIYKG